LKINTTTPFGLSFAQITKLYFGALSHMLEDLPLERHFTTLLMIDKATEKCTQQYLSVVLNIDKVSMVRIMDYLSEKGMIKRVVNPDDRREFFIVLTARGKKIMPDIYAAVKELNDIAMKGISIAKKKEFEESLRLVMENLANMPANNVNIKIKKSVKA
jgi:DNA-binding MarR family transcriptional regulator